MSDLSAYSLSNARSPPSRAPTGYASPSANSPNFPGRDRNPSITPSFSSTNTDTSRSMMSPPSVVRAPPAPAGALRRTPSAGGYGRAPATSGPGGGPLHNPSSSSAMSGRPGGGRALPPISSLASMSGPSAINPSRGYIPQQSSQNYGEYPAPNAPNPGYGYPEGPRQRRSSLGARPTGPGNLSRPPSAMDLDQPTGLHNFNSPPAALRQARSLAPGALAGSAGPGAGANPRTATSYMSMREPERGRGPAAGMGSGAAMGARPSLAAMRSSSRGPPQPPPSYANMRPSSRAPSPGPSNVSMRSAYTGSGPSGSSSGAYPAMKTGYSRDDMEPPPPSSGAPTSGWPVSGPGAAAGPHACDVPGCGRSFTRQYNLKAHQTTHVNDKKHRCDFCTQMFARRHDKERHERMHTGEKPYLCDQCNKGFARSDALSRHRLLEPNCGSGFAGKR